MELANFITKFFLLLIPGTIGILLFYYLNPVKERHYYIEFMKISIFSFLSFSLTSWSIWFSKSSPIPFDPVQLFTNNAANIGSNELMLSIVFAVILSLVASKINSGNYLFKLLNKIKIINKTSNNQVWDIALRELSVISVRDLKYKLVYYGCLVDYSDNSDIRELYLSNVDVYSDSSLLYKAEKLYISRNHDEIIVEVSDYSTREEENNA